jgi:hypothetical protein
MDNPVILINPATGIASLGLVVGVALLCIPFHSFL